MRGSRTWALRNRVSPSTRHRVRAATDRLSGPLGSIRAARTADPVFALTYDDGPDPVRTARVLSALDELGVRATFFQLVLRARRDPGVTREVVACGHEVALHGLDHTRLTLLPPAAVHARLLEARESLEDLAGRPVRWFRPPYGAQSVRTFAAARRAGLQPVVWGPTVADWREGSAREVAGRGLQGLRPGAILLAHDAFETPADDPSPEPRFDRGEMTRHLVTLARERGLEPVPVGELLRHGPAWRTAWFRP